MISQEQLTQPVTKKHKPKTTINNNEGPPRHGDAFRVYTRSP